MFLVVNGSMLLKVGFDLRTQRETFFFHKCCNIFERISMLDYFVKRLRLSTFC